MQRIGGGFEDVAMSSTDLKPLRSRLLSDVPGVVHGLTRRHAGMGRADGNIGYSPPRDRDDAWVMRRRWCEAIGVEADQLVTLSQIHGAKVLRVGASDAGRGARPGSGQPGQGDALITDEPGVALMTLHADCLPILVVDPDRPAVAAIHAGWRGTVGDIAGAAVRAMHDAYGSRPDRMLAFLGPGASGCCYRVGDDVLAAWEGQAGGQAETALHALDGQPTFDLAAANAWLLRRARLVPDRIEVSGICTRCDGDDWFSHRGQGADTGRFAAIIAIEPHAARSSWGSDYVAR
jgi:YfiH family protein